MVGPGGEMVKTARVSKGRRVRATERRSMEDERGGAHDEEEGDGAYETTASRDGKAISLG